MHVITPLGCASCYPTTIKGRLGAASSGATIIGVLAFTAIALTLLGAMRKKDRR